MHKPCAALLSVLAACLFAQAAAGEQIRIGVALPTQSEERWVRDRETMEAEAKKHNIDLRIQIARNDQMMQNNQIDQLLTQGIKVLIVTPHDAEAAAVAAKAAHAEGIKILCYSRIIKNGPVDLFITFDLEGIGRQQAEWLVARKPKGNYVILAGAATDANAAVFLRGSMKVLQPLIDKGDIKVVMQQSVDDWMPKNAQRLVENALTLADNKVDAILCPNDGTASGAIAALEAQGLAGKVLTTGQDAELAAVQRIAEGTQGMSIFMDTRDLAREAMALAVRMAKGEDIVKDAKGVTFDNGFMKVPTIYLPTTPVDKDNYEKLLIEGGYHSREAIFSKEGKK